MEVNHARLKIRYVFFSHFKQKYIQFLDEFLTTLTAILSLYIVLKEMNIFNQVKIFNQVPSFYVKIEQTLSTQ